MHEMRNSFSGYLRSRVAAAAAAAAAG